MKKTLSRVLLSLLMCMQMIQTTTVSAANENTKASTIQITDEQQLEPYFPDKVFREAVFGAVRDGKDGAEGATVEEALYNFRGKVTYNGHNQQILPQKPKIYDAHGIEYLRNAEEISLKYNEIRDLRFLQDATESNETAIKTHYGELIANDPDVDIDGKNVVWDFAGNPLEMLPFGLTPDPTGKIPPFELLASGFGGRLKILQPGSSSYTYKEDLSKKWVYIRDDSNAGEMDITKTSIWKGNTKVGDTPIDNCNPYYGIPGDTNIGLTITNFTDNKAYFTGPVRSGTAHLSVGTGIDLYYWTQDEYGNITPGGQSHKYYLTYTFKVYDKISVSSVLDGIAVLTKTDQDTGAALAGAVYGVYKEDGTFVKEVTTGVDGKATVSGLHNGNYYFKETKAPQGYKLDTTEKKFTITTTGVTPPKTIVGGGETEVETTAGQIVKAGADEVLFSGGYDIEKNLLSPDITLSSDKIDEIASAEVTYSKLRVNGTTQDNVVRTFNTLDEAQADINKEKNNPDAYEDEHNNTLSGTNILGPVSVKVFYDDPGQTEVKVSATNEAYEVIDISGEKVWSDYDNKLNTRPDKITVNLLQEDINGTVQQIDSKEVTANDNWRFTFTGVRETDDDGNKYTYSIEEENIADYDSVITGDADKGFTITNTVNENKNTTQISGEKTWKDYNNALETRPESVTIAILQNNVEYTTVEATAANDWKYTANDLPKLDTNGNEYTYTIKETNVKEGYSAVVNGTTITNTLDTSKNDIVKVEGQKTWSDYNNAWQLRPGTIKVELYQNGTKYASKDVTILTDWKYSWEKLPKFDVDGKAYTYEIKEVAIDKYDTKVDGNNITNTLKTEINDVVEVSGTKTWVDDENAYGTRPESITVTLLQNGKATDKAITVSEKDNWSYSFKKLPKFDVDGKAIQYSVSEQEVKGYKQDIKGNDITNTLKSEKISVNIEKVWIDKEDSTEAHPDITVHLLQNGKEIDEVTLKAGTTTYEFKNLLKTDLDGTDYVYTIEEDGVAGYTTSVEGLKITNTFENEFMNISGKKTWVDDENAYGTRPESITINLLQNGKATDKKLTVTEETNWEYRFNDLPKYDDTGKKYEYSVSEETVKGYTQTIAKTDITNTLKSEKISVNIEKVWIDKEDSTEAHPDITVHLLQNGKEIDEITLKAGTTTYEFKNLLKTDLDGTDYVYTIEEDGVAGYTTSVEGFKITNTFENEFMNISGKKTWVDDENAYGTRPESITVNLLQNGKATDKKLTVTEETNWEYTFNDLPKYDGTGKKYEYSVSEETVKGYTQTITKTDITNTLSSEKISFTIHKEWKDNEDFNGTHPDITIRLLRNGEEVESAVLKHGETQYTFKNLLKSDLDGNDYVYTLKEDQVKGYITTINKNTITNKAENSTVEVSGKKTWVDDNNAYKTRPTQISIDLYQNNTKLKTVTITEKDNWAYSFKDLVKYDSDGKKFTYTVKESNVPKKYTMQISGTNITNTLKEEYKKKPKDPSTGDSTNFGGYVFLTISALGIMGFAKRKKTQK